VLAVRAALLGLGVLLTLVAYGITSWIILGITLSLWGACSPRQLLAWALILFLALGQLAHDARLDWRVLVLLAGLQLLHTAAILTLELPWRARVQPQVFIAPVARFLTIQIACQPLAIITLILLAPKHNGHRPLTLTAIGTIGAIAIASLTILMLRPRIGRH
jgi:hypothetical protein